MSTKLNPIRSWMILYGDMVATITLSDPSIMDQVLETAYEFGVDAFRAAIDAARSKDRIVSCAEAEDGCQVSVGGLVGDIAAREKKPIRRIRRERKPRPLSGKPKRKR